MNLTKRLIINADDYGGCPEIDEAVEQLASSGRLGGVSVLANGDCWESAASFLGSHRELSAGIHLNVVEGRPVANAREVAILTQSDGSFVALSVLLRRWVLSPRAVSRAVETEWRAQIERLIDSGLQLQHADSHRHVHAFPPAYRMAARLCQEYSVPALRWPMERKFKSRRLPSLAISATIAISGLLRSSAEVFRNDHFLGFQRAGSYTNATLLADLRLLADGLTELALHASTRDGWPYASFNGRQELQAVLDERLPGWLDELSIQLTSWEKATQL